MISQYHIVGICHHEHTQVYQNMFVKHVKHEIHIEYGKTFLDANHVLYNVFIGTTCPLSAINCIMSPEFAGKQHNETFVREKLANRVFSMKTTIKNNQLDLKKALKDSKSNSSKVKDLKNLAATLFRLHFANKVPGGDTLEFFSQENVRHSTSIW